MEDLSQRVSAARQLLYRFLKSFFILGIDEARFEAWRELLTHLEPVEFGPFDQSLQALKEAVELSSAQEAEEEFHYLFLDPFEGQKIPLEASYYLDGKLFGPSLARLRGWLQETGLAKAPQIKEPEDHLALLLDFMESLIEEGDLPSQKELFQTYLVPCAKGVVQNLKKQEKFPLYKALAHFLEGFLALEEKFWEETKEA